MVLCYGPLIDVGKPHLGPLRFWHKVMKASEFFNFDGLGV